MRCYTVYVPLSSIPCPDHVFLQVLGEGELSKALTIEAAKFSSSASEKISAAGATATVLPLRKKWTRKAHEKVRALRWCLEIARWCCAAAAAAAAAESAPSGLLLPLLTASRKQYQHTMQKNISTTGLIASRLIAG